MRFLQANVDTQNNAVSSLLKWWKVCQIIGFSSSQRSVFFQFLLILHWWRTTFQLFGWLPRQLAFLKNVWQEWKLRQKEHKLWLSQRNEAELNVVQRIQMENPLWHFSPMPHYARKTLMQALDAISKMAVGNTVEFPSSRKRLRNVLGFPTGQGNVEYSYV